MRRAALLLTLALVATNAIAAQKPVPAVVEQPRSFGYTVGDIVTQRVLLSTARQTAAPNTPGKDFDPTALPPAQRVNIWFERRAARIEKAADGQRWLVVDYQLINAPPKLTTVPLPGWIVESKEHNTRVAVPAASISVSPLISETPAAEVRPDREVSIIDTGPALASLVAWSSALVVTLIAWLIWTRWRNWRDSHNRPFARALREMSGIDEMAPEAWQSLHRAFDQTAGRVLQIETLPMLFDRAPHLQTQRADIERFFAQSNERFFGAGPHDSPLSVRTLCQELRRIERRHAS